MSLPNNPYCGPSGWSYPHWNGVVYPASRSRGFHALEYLAQFFDTVEINTTFYQPIRPEIARLWVRKVAANPRFLFTAKLQRRFTHERLVDAPAVAAFKEGMLPLLRAGKLGCLLMQFPWTFRYTQENREFFIGLRRAFHEFPLVTEMRHASWMAEEAVGTLIDYRVGFCNVDQPVYIKAMPPTSFLTSGVGYVRLHGRDRQNWNQAERHDYLYSRSELLEWKPRIERLQQLAEKTFVFANNDGAGKSVVNALQLAQALGAERRFAPAELIRKYRHELTDFHPERPVQSSLFGAFETDRRVA